MRIYKFVMTFAGMLSVTSVYAICHFGNLYFLPGWKGGLEDKTLISLGLLFSLALFLIALEHFLIMSICSVVRSLRSPITVNYSSLTAIIKAVLFPFKCIAYFSSIVIASGLLNIVVGVIAALIVGYFYFFKIPDLNRIINEKIAGGFCDEAKFN